MARSLSVQEVRADAAPGRRGTQVGNDTPPQEASIILAERRPSASGRVKSSRVTP